MALHDFLAPDENIKYSSPEPVEIQGDLFDFHLTNKRFIWHKTRGLIFKKDSFIAEVLSKVTGIQFREEGLFSKRSTIVIEMGDRKKEFSGKSKVIKTLYGEIQALMN
jgi:hypothetical protein